jgi:hypothetical protein
LHADCRERSGRRRRRATAVFKQKSGEFARNIATLQKRHAVGIGETCTGIEQLLPVGTQRDELGEIAPIALETGVEQRRSALGVALVHNGGTESCNERIEDIDTGRIESSNVQKGANRRVGGQSAKQEHQIVASILTNRLGKRRVAMSIDRADIRTAAHQQLHSFAQTRIVSARSRHCLVQRSGAL